MLLLKRKFHKARRYKLVTNFGALLQQTMPTHLYLYLQINSLSSVEIIHSVSHTSVLVDFSDCDSYSRFP